jgi:hypothetical protein
LQISLHKFFKISTGKERGAKAPPRQRKLTKQLLSGQDSRRNAGLLIKGFSSGLLAQAKWGISLGHPALGGSLSSGHFYPALRRCCCHSLVECDPGLLFLRQTKRPDRVNVQSGPSK